MTFGRLIALLVGLLGLGLAGWANAENRGHQMLKDAEAREKRQVLGRIVGSKGHRCRAWDVSFKELKDGKSYWVTKCMSGRSYLVMIRPDEEGTTEVWNCDNARQEEGMACSSGNAG